MLELDDIIDSPASLEIKRALAVKMMMWDLKPKQISILLNVSEGFVSKWKVIYEDKGAKGLRLNYTGGKGFLTKTQRLEILLHLKDEPHYSVDKLRELIKNRYGIVYQSSQSYYDLLKAGGLSWHQTQAINPRRDELEVLLKRQELKKLDACEAEIKSGEVVVFAQDECHLLAGDATGYVWGQRNERTEVPIENSRDRQTYYGGLNLYNQQFFIKPYPTGNGENTIAFLKDLQAAYRNKKLIILWDNASYHKGKEVQKYLNEVNEGITDEKDRKINCYPFAPNAPDQNPVEDVWLRGKDFLRKHFYESEKFHQMKRRFLNYLDKKIFNFKKLE